MNWAFCEKSRHVVVDTKIPKGQYKESNTRIIRWFTKCGKEITGWRPKAQGYEVYNRTNEPVTCQDCM